MGSSARRDTSISATDTPFAILPASTADEKLAKVKAEIEKRRLVAMTSFRVTGSAIQYGEGIALRDLLSFIAALDSEEGEPS